MNRATHFDRSEGVELALGRLDGFSIEKYEKKRESFRHYPAKFESGEVRFSGGKIARCWSR